MQLHHFLAALAAATPLVTAAAKTGSFSPCKNGLVTINGGEYNAMHVHCNARVASKFIGDSTAEPSYKTFAACAQACSEAGTETCCAAQFVEKDSSCTWIGNGDSACSANSAYLGKGVEGTSFAVVKPGTSG